jgi:hypothetical protein
MQEVETAVRKDNPPPGSLMPGEKQIQFLSFKHAAHGGSLVRQSIAAALFAISSYHAQSGRRGDAKRDTPRAFRYSRRTHRCYTLAVKFRAELASDSFPFVAIVASIVARD